MGQDKIIIFGASCGGVIAYESFSDSHNIIAFSDNDKNRQGKQLVELPIIAPEDIPPDCKVIIASAYIGDIMPQLEQAGVQVLWRESMAFADNLFARMDHCLTEYLDTTGQPIIIYHMGKVGSTSIETLIRNRGLDFFSCIHLNAKAAQRLRTESEKRTIKIISLVRDPVARDIAALFHYFPDTAMNNRALLEGVSEMDITTMITSILKHSEMSAIHWFEKELIRCIGIDIFNHPFDQKSASLRIQQGNIDLLLIKLEHIDNSTVALAEFLGVAVNEIPKINLASRKWYACLYDEFKRNFKADDDYLRQMYESLYSRHFYSGQEIQAFMEKWRR